MANSRERQDNSLPISASNMSRFQSLSPLRESWVDISSLPSSSSVSSVAGDIPAASTVVVPPDSKLKKRTRSLHPSQHTSSQDEDEESESESDNKNKNDDHDDLPISLGIEESAILIAGSTFTPSPNAFTHPPPQPHFLSNPRHSYPSTARTNRANYNHISPSLRIDHDAILRASLSTLLSCAAARRPKSATTDAATSASAASLEATNNNNGPPASNQIVSDSIGLVSESALLAPPQIQKPVTVHSTPKTSKPKTTTTTRSTSKDRRAASKKSAKQGLYRTTSATSSSSTATTTTSAQQEVTPTLTTWVMGAGMLVLVSALSFSTGYSVGREVGHTEANALHDVGHAVKRNLASPKGSGLSLRKWTDVAVRG